MADTVTDVQLSELQDWYTFNSENGTIDPKDYGEVADVIDAEMKSVFGMSEDINPSTPLGRMVEWLAVFFTDVLHLNVQNANQLLLSAAAGQQLDAMAQWFQLYRRKGTRTTVTVKVSGTAGTIINAGARARTNDGAYFAATSALSIPSEGFGYMTFQAVQYGATPCPVGALNVIDTPILGWTSIVNEEAGSVGSPLLETDESLRDRIRSERTSAIGFLGSIKNALERISTVKSANVLENNTGSALALAGISLSPHSIFVCVDGENTPVEDLEIAQAIFDNKPCGTGYSSVTGSGASKLNNNKEDIIVTDPFGNNYTVTFFRPTTIAITTVLTVVKRNYAGTNVVDDVTAAVDAWFKNKPPTIGETVFASDIMLYIEQNISGIVVMDIKVTGAGQDAATQYYEIGGWQKAVYGTVVCTVQ